MHNRYDYFLSGLEVKYCQHFSFIFQDLVFFWQLKKKEVNRKQFNFLSSLKFTLNKLEWFPMVYTVGNLIIHRETVDSWSHGCIIRCLVLIKVIVYARCCKAEKPFQKPMKERMFLMISLDRVCWNIWEFYKKNRNPG